MSTSVQPSGQSFTRTRLVRTAAGIASAGVMAGFSLVGAASASAATDADCTVGNTVSTGVAADIQTLLNTNPSLICIDGSYAVTNALIYSTVTLHGLPGAEFVSDGSDAILRTIDGGTTLTVENLHFTGGSNFNGGAIEGADVNATNSVFDNNEAFFGGAISGYTVVATGSTFQDNSGVFGGAILANYSANATSSTFAGNYADYEGGAIFSYGVTDVDSSTFTENTASSDGGALFSQDSLSVQNSTFVGNTSSRGGAIFGYLGTVWQSTFLDNASDEGEGNSIFKSGTGEFDVRGNIFAGDTTDAQLWSDDPGSLQTDLGGNLFTTAASTETALTSVQPSSLFGLTSAALFNGATLANNGGTTETVALYDGSPAIDAVPVGSPSVTVDQRGVARDALSDAGAYEFFQPKAVLAATGSTPATWLGGVAALMLGLGVAAFGVARRVTRTR